MKSYRHFSSLFSWMSQKYQILLTTPPFWNVFPCTTFSIFPLICFLLFLGLWHPLLWSPSSFKQLVSKVLFLEPLLFHYIYSLQHQCSKFKKIILGSIETVSWQLHNALKFSYKNSFGETEFDAFKKLFFSKTKKFH